LNTRFRFESTSQEVQAAWIDERLPLLTGARNARQSSDRRSDPSSLWIRRGDWRRPDVNLQGRPPATRAERIVSNDPTRAPFFGSILTVRADVPCLFRNAVAQNETHPAML
jgi:hypothetical protein